MLYSNRYVTPGAPALLILAALGINSFARAHVLSRRLVFGLAALFVVVGALTAIAPATTQGLSATRFDDRLRVVRAAIALTPVLCLPFAARGRWRPAVVGVLTVATVVAVNGFAIGLWLRHNAFYVDDDACAARYGVALGAATAEDASVAVTWGGAIPYFSHRTAIDLLGKSDRVVAMRARQSSVGFEPGHDKWDYSYSIGQLQPDVVAQLWHGTDEDVRAIERSGYVRLAPWTFARADSPRVNRLAVRRAACEVLSGNPFVAGSPTRTVSDLDDLVARYCRE
jgi:hypothetical protein